MADKMVRLTGLYKKEDKNGNIYMTGKTRERIVLEAGTWVSVFKNTYKEADKDPDYTVNISAPVDTAGKKPSTKGSDIPF